MKSLAGELKSKAQSLGLISEVVDLKNYEPEDSLSEEVRIHVDVRICGLQGWTLALARSPRRVSKVSGECKSQITRPFGECDFSSPRN